MENERDNPDGAANDGALSMDDGAAAIEALFDPPAKDKDETESKATVESEGEAAEESTTAEAGEEQEATAEETTEGEAEQTEEQAAQEPVIITDDNALVTMPDGSKVTVRELRDSGLRHADYTRKAMDLGERNKQTEVQEQRVLETAKVVAQQRDLVIQFMQQNLPQPPSAEEWKQVDPAVDPVAFMELQNRQQHFDRTVRSMQQLQQAKAAEEQQQQAEFRANMEKRAAEQSALLYQHHPELKDPVKREQVYTKLGNGMRQLGFSDQEWQGYIRDPRADHRVVRAMIEAAEYRALKAQKPAVAKAVGEKPKMLKPGKAATSGNKANADRQAAFERQRKSGGSLKDSIDALMQFEL